MSEPREHQTPGLPKRMHFLEPGGRGGVFQHTVELARRIGELGTAVIVHTASDYEDLGCEGVEFCGCVRWHRDVRARWRRAALIVGDYAFRTFRHLRRECQGQIVHVQGLFRGPLLPYTVAMLGRHAQRVLFSPHNTFSRAGHKYEESMLRWACRRAGTVVVFSGADAEKLAGWGISSFVCPLVIYVPPRAAELVPEWRDRLRSGSPDPVVLVPGQMRTDKGIDDVLSAAAVLRRPLTVAVVGEDKGGLVGSKRYAEQLGVRANWIVGYQDMADFAAAVCAADVVVTPYSRASQSGVLVLACQLGTPTIAFPAGGLAEYATVTTERADPVSLVDSLADFFDGERPAVRELPPVEQYLKELYAS